MCLSTDITCLAKLIWICFKSVHRPGDLCLPGTIASIKVKQRSKSRACLHVMPRLKASRWGHLLACPVLGVRQVAAAACLGPAGPLVRLATTAGTAAGCARRATASGCLPALQSVAARTPCRSRHRFRAQRQQAQKLKSKAIPCMRQRDCRRTASKKSLGNAHRSAPAR